MLSFLLARSLPSTGESSRPYASITLLEIKPDPSPPSPLSSPSSDFLFVKCAYPLSFYYTVKSGAD
jgi:hypothetical protein